MKLKCNGVSAFIHDLGDTKVIETLNFYVSLRLWYMWTVTIASDYVQTVV